MPFDEKVKVTVYDENGDYVGETEASPTSLPAYTYRIELPAGSYLLALDTTPGNCVQVGGPCQGDLQATVGSGQTTTFNYAVTPWGRISGNIGASAPGAFASYVSIHAEGSSYGYSYSFGEPYTLDCLAPGSDYKLFFDPEEYLSEWYNDQPDSSHATAVTVVAGQTTGVIDVVLAAGGGISGTVYPEAPSTFTSGVYVMVNSAAVTKYAYAYAGNGFTYSFKGLRTGDYTVFFEPGDNHLPMWYQNSSDTPTPVHVTEGETRTAVNTTLPVRPSLGKIVGTVTDGSGASLGGSASVVVYDGSGNYVASAGIDSATNGYEVDRLGTGDYFVFFSAESSCPLYVSEWYDNASTLAGATPVHVVAGGTPTTANAQLAKLPAPGKIEGDVTLAGKRIDWRTQVQVFFYDSTQSEVARGNLGSCNGHYEVCVPPGSYKVKFVASGVGYVVQWFDGKPGEAAADTVVVGAGETKSQIDADLAPRPENRAPVLDPIGDKTVQENQLLQFNLSGSDADGDSLTFSATNLPAWADFDPFTRQVTLTPPPGSAGGYPDVVFTVSDSALADTETITVTVTSAVINRAPVLNPIGNRTVQEGQSLQFIISGSDLDADDTLDFSATNLPAWAVFGPVSRTLTGTPGYRDAGSYATVTFAVSDGALTDSETITITVADKTPFFVDAFSDQRHRRLGLGDPHGRVVGGGGQDPRRQTHEGRHRHREDFRRTARGLHRRDPVGRHQARWGQDTGRLHRLRLAGQRPLPVRGRRQGPGGHRTGGNHRRHPARRLVKTVRHRSPEVLRQGRGSRHRCRRPVCGQKEGPHQELRGHPARGGHRRPVQEVANLLRQLQGGKLGQSAPPAGEGHGPFPSWRFVPHCPRDLLDGPRTPTYHAASRSRVPGAGSGAVAGKSARHSRGVVHGESGTGFGKGRGRRAWSSVR